MASYHFLLQKQTSIHKITFRLIRSDAVLMDPEGNTKSLLSLICLPPGFYSMCPLYDRALLTAVPMSI